MSFVFVRVWLFVLILPTLMLMGCARGPASAAVTNKSLVVVVNVNDADSVAAGMRYLQVHDIAPERLIQVKLPVQDVLSAQEFFAFQATLDRQLPADTAGLAMVWQRPYRVDCMSITSAVAFRGDRAACASQCGLTRTSPWVFDPDGRQKNTRGVLRSMLVTGGDLEETLALINRAATPRLNLGSVQALLVRSGDRARDVRGSDFRALHKNPPAGLNIQLLNQFPSDAAGVMFYFTGAVRVPHLDQIDFLPGSVADHLTSFGGRLYGSSQMSVLEWIRAGASGSYGAVVEPCNHVNKFPNPNLLVPHYAGGSTLLEAYWASVEMPGQGLFVGDPLVRWINR